MYKLKKKKKTFEKKRLIGKLVHIKEQQFRFIFSGYIIYITHPTKVTKPKDPSYWFDFGKIFSNQFLYNIGSRFTLRYFWISLIYYIMSKYCYYSQTYGCFHIFTNKFLILKIYSHKEFQIKFSSFFSLKSYNLATNVENLIFILYKFAHHIPTIISLK